MALEVIGIDLGGTRIKGVALDHNGAVIRQLYTATKDGADAEWKMAVLETVEKLSEGNQDSGICVGISAPGLPDETNKKIAHMPGRLDGLENFHWSEYLEKDTWVLNDAVSALMAEASLGVAKTKKHVVMLTLGTGVGGAILIHGKLYQGAFHKAGHVGHMVINDGGDPDVTGMPGSLEESIGNCTVEKRSKGKFLSTHDLLNAARAGDTNAKEIWLASVRKLAIGLASITNVLSRK